MDIVIDALLLSNIDNRYTPLHPNPVTSIQFILRPQLYFTQFTSTHQISLLQKNLLKDFHCLSSVPSPFHKEITCVAIASITQCNPRDRENQKRDFVRNLIFHERVYIDTHTRTKTRKK